MATARLPENRLFAGARKVVGWSISLHRWNRIEKNWFLITDVIGDHIVESVCASVSYLGPEYIYNKMFPRGPGRMS